MDTDKPSGKRRVALPSSIRATPIADVFGSAGYRGPAKSVRQMDAAVASEAKKRARR